MLENQKKIWITGASSGIGKAVAKKFAKEGWKVAISARRRELLDEIAKNENIVSFPLDVTDRAQINDVFKNILKEFQNLDICLFSSGTYEPKDEQNIDPDKIKNVMDVNFLGVIDCVKAVEEYFKNKQSGHISLVSSIAGYRGLPNSSGYGPSKAALTNFSESIYFDFKKYGIRISVVSPGFIKTPLTDKNEFPMPFLKTPEYAAEKIFNGLVKGSSFEIHFPKGLTLILKFLRILPYRLYLFLVDKLVKR
ncbi:MAG: short-chain dehydrogenase [Candidatus Pelagibacter sp.]|nr:short-chain dehydrogenase [Candidatus Pelagibacter sp.]|tara:strand:+ start:309 stop:1061 length:753 start_codon:yes stop_codon:yes gene_type:complete